MSQPDYSAAALTKQPGALAALINSGSETTRLWRPEELSAIFRHQLSAPVFVDLGQLPKGAAARLKQLSDAHGLLLKSFSELFHHQAPPLELLELTKDFAKANMDHPESALPSEIATALYYTSIAAAYVRLGARISRLKDSDLRRGWLWTRDQGWIDEKTKALLVEALSKGSLPSSKTGPAA
jgi:hypothetical protein